ncbi:MAG: FkbM family methyltransferase [Caulobacteraceae bacterium]
MGDVRSTLTIGTGRRSKFGARHGIADANLAETEAQVSAPCLTLWHEGRTRRFAQPRCAAGCGLGYWSVRWQLDCHGGRHLAGAQFHCFEPLQIRAAALAELSARHPGFVAHHHVGLSDADGERSLGVTDDLWGSSFAYKGASSQVVQVRTLDSMHAEGVIPKANFVKIDVQGWERRVIAGGNTTLAHCDFVLMECTFYPFCAEMQRLDETIAFMADAGFSPYEFVDFLRRPVDDAMGQCDILFIRRDHEFMRNTRWE